MELKELIPELKVLELEAPQYAMLQGAGPLVDYQ